MQIKVWWCDDAMYYDGWIESFEEVSREHRINYSDGEWEFLSLTTEDVLIDLIDREDLRSTTALATTLTAAKKKSKSNMV